MSGEADLAAVAAEVRACTRCPPAAAARWPSRGGQPDQRRAAGGGGTGPARGRHGAPVRGRRRAAPRGDAREHRLATDDVFITNVVKCRRRATATRSRRDQCLLAVPRPPGAGARPGPDRDPGPPFAPALPARGAHLRGPRPAPPAGSRFVLPMYHPAAALRATALRETLARDFRPAGRLLEARGALGVTGRLRAVRIRAHGTAPEDRQEPLPAHDDDQMTLF